MMQQQVNEQNFHYKLIPKYTLKQKRHSTAIAINYSNTIVYAAKDETIIMFQFKAGLKQLSQVKSHKSDIVTLNIFRFRSDVISGSKDNSIILWSSKINQNFKYLTKLKGHSDQITCLVIHPFLNNLIISGSQDKSIKFWSFGSSQGLNLSPFCWSCSQTITQHYDSIAQISINSDGKKLISCSDKQILILNFSQSQKWQVFQMIVIREVGVRLSFINENLFAYQPWSGKYIQIYFLDPADRKYYRIREIQVQGDHDPCWFYFPSLYAKSKNILMCKNGHKVNLLQFTFSCSDWECKLQQSIDYGHDWIFGSLSEDGMYLITSDWLSKSIQIRQYTQECKDQKYSKQYQHNTNYLNQKFSQIN